MDEFIAPMDEYPYAKEHLHISNNEKHCFKARKHYSIDFGHSVT